MSSRRKSSAASTPKKAAAATKSPKLDTQSFAKAWKKIRADTPEYDTQLLNRITEEVYGELNPNMVAHIIDLVGITANDVFFELGCGVGNVVFQIAAQVGCEAIGIDHRAEMTKIADALKDETINQLGHNHPIGKIGIRTGQYLHTDIIGDINRATVVLTNNLAWSPEREMQILEMLQLNLKAGTRVVSLRNFAPRFRPSSLLFKHHPCHMFEFPWKETIGPEDGVSWSNKPIPIQVYTVAKKGYNAKEESASQSASEPQEEDVKPASKGKTPVRRSVRRSSSRQKVQEDTQQEEEEEEGGKRKTTSKGKKDDDVEADALLLEAVEHMPPRKKAKGGSLAHSKGSDEGLSPDALEWKHKYEEVSRKLDDMEGTQLQFEVLEGKLHETEGELAERTKQLHDSQARVRDLEQQLGIPSSDSMQVEGADDESRKRKRDDWCSVQ